MSVPFQKYFAGKTVLVTGHTGFKGAWLCLWLKELGAKVVGYSLPPSTEPNLFTQLRLAESVDSRLGDVRDAGRLQEVFQEVRPEIVFHLAAQALVRASYEDPAGTFSTNVMGTVNLLEAVRRAGSVRVCQVITSDKCYENRESGQAYQEDDRLGGRDPYSASKACAELVVASYRDSFFPVDAVKRHGVSLSSTRAGNVIGGGDWTKDRIVPDCVRALSQGKPIVVRNPSSIRPWQHVLEPLSGYLRLCSLQLSDPARYAQAWNFGPDDSQSVPVADIVQEAIRCWGAGDWHCPPAQGEPYEAKTLRLHCAKAREFLGWEPVYDVQESVSATISWYKESLQDARFDAVSYTLGQIDSYVKKAATEKVLS